MTHTQMTPPVAPQYLLAQHKFCPLSPVLPISVLGDVKKEPPSILDKLSGEARANGGDVFESAPQRYILGINDDDADQIDLFTVDRGELHIEDGVEPAPSWSHGKWGMVVGSLVSAAAFSSVGALYFLAPIGGVA